MRKFAGVLAAVCLAGCATGSLNPSNTGKFARSDSTQGLTWKEANHLSADLIRKKGYSLKAADLDQAAFDLYPAQGETYNERNHAQLLLNLVDARLQTNGLKSALNDLDHGVEIIGQHTGPDNAIFIDIWQEAARISLAEWRTADGYDEKASALADKLWGENDPRAIAALMKWANDLRREHGYRWTKVKYTAARERAVKSGEDSAPVSEVDLNFARLELEQNSFREAINAYRALIERLEASKDPAKELILQTAYAQLEYAYEKTGDDKARDEIHQRLAQHFGTKGEEELLLQPLVRVAPFYPHDAALRGIEGSVKVKLAIKPDGTVRAVSVVASQPPGVFNRATTDALLKWKFMPKIVDGKPVEQEGFQTMEFKLR